MRDGGSASQYAYAREQFHEREGFDQVVIAPGFKSVHAVVDAAHRGQINDRCHDRLRAQSFAQFQPIDAWKHPVEHDHLVIAAGSQVQASQSVGCMVDSVLMIAQSIDHRSSHFEIIFNQQNLHR